MSKSANIRVVVRFRPANEREKLLASSGAYAGSEYLSFGEGGNLSIANAIGAGAATQAFAFDSVLGAEAGAAQVFEDVAAGPVADVLEGYNATIFAYGQTGAGKVTLLMLTVVLVLAVLVLVLTPRRC